MVTSWFEVLMLICFGASWPFSIAKALRTKVVAGKSVVFLYIIIAGYLFGIAHKVFYSPDRVVYLYAFNACLVAVDIVLWHRYSRNPVIPAAG